MSAAKRVLIVEDRPDVLQTYMKNVLRAGFIVDTASTKEEALEKVRRRTYHVAMIDVNLTDFSGGDGNDRSGIEIVRKIKAQGEGTRCIVISGEKNAEVPVDAKEAGYDKYIIKKRIRDPEDYVEPVKQQANECVLQTTGQRFGDLIAYLCFPEKRWAWEGDVMRVLKCNGENMPRILWEVFDPYLPALRQRDGSIALSIASDLTKLTGAFWSKAAACPIWVAIGRKGADIAPPSTTIELLSGRSKGPFPFAVWKIDSFSRRDFIDSADDLR